MPYITEDRRRVMFPGQVPTNAGELNYCFTMMVLESDDMRGLHKDIADLGIKYIEAKGMKYQHANDVMGAITGAKLEYVRRTGRHKFDSLFDDAAKVFYATSGIGPYEDTKIKENGDLDYPPRLDEHAASVPRG